MLRQEAEALYLEAEEIAAKQVQEVSYNRSSLWDPLNMVLGFPPRAEQQVILALLHELSGSLVLYAVEYKIKICSS